MNLKRFKKMLSIYGSDLNHWENIDPEMIRSFMDTSEQAATLYHEAEALDKALDSYEVEALQPGVSAQIMEQIDAKRSKKKPENHTKISFTLPDFLKENNLAWAGGVAAFATILLFWWGPFPEQPSSITQPVKLASVQKEEKDIDIFLADIFTEDDDLMSFFHMAEQTPAQDDQEVEELLNTLFGTDDNPVYNTPDNESLEKDSSGNTEANEETDLWELFYTSDIVKL